MPDPPIRESDTERSSVHEASFELRHPEHFRRCSWCGSVHPGDLLIARASGQIKHVDRSVDRKYGWPHKIYVDIADQLGQLDWLGGSSSDMSDEEMARYSRESGGWKRVGDLTPEERTAVGADRLGRYKVVGVGVRSVHHGKFYSVHTLEPFLDDQERDQLFAMVGYTFEWASESPVDSRIRWYPYNYGSQPA